MTTGQVLLLAHPRHMKWQPRSSLCRDEPKNPSHNLPESDLRGRTQILQDPRSLSQPGRKIVAEAARIDENVALLPGVQTFPFQL
jgi:hypothetical protein